MAATLEVDPSQVHSIEVDPSQVSAASDAPGPVSRFVGNFVSALNPFPALKHYIADVPAEQQAELADKLQKGDYAGAVGSIVKTAAKSAVPGLGPAVDVVAAQAHQFVRAYEDLKDTKDMPALSDRLSSAAGHTAAGLLPVLGPAAANAGEQIGAGDVAGGLGAGAGLVASVYAPRVISKTAAKVGAVVDKLPAAVKIPSTLDPSEAAAVQYGREQEVPMSVGTQTQSKPILNAENILQNVPVAGRVAATAREAQTAALTSLGSGEVAALAPGAAPGGAVPQPLDVGEAIHKTAIDNERAHAQRANDQYDLLRSIENQPQFKTEVQQGVRSVDAVDANGNAIKKQEPILEDVQLPVDYRQMKAAVKPLLAEVRRPMSIAQEQSSTGIKAMQNIMDSPDFVPASIADQDLGALKGIMRDSPQSRSVGQAKFAADLLSKQIDSAVARAGPDAVNALKDGRAATVDRYDAQKFQTDIGFKNVGTGSLEPGSAVDLVNKITRPADRSIALLRSVADHAPEHIPAIAQAVTQNLVEKALAEAKMGKPKTALTEFNGLGDQTQSILFGARAPALKNFFTLQKMIADNPNPSGSGSLLAMGKAGMLVLTQPHIGVPLLFGAKKVAQMLFNPETSRLMQTAMQTPAGTPGAGLLAQQLAARAAATPASGIASPAAGASQSIASGSGATGNPGQVGTAGGAVRTGAPAGAPASAGQGSALTRIGIPGKPGPGYQAQYKIGELSDFNASHNGLTFGRNPNYELENTRDYENPVNQAKIVNGAGRGQFNPAYHTTDAPDALNGPPVTDERGNVIAGNGRAMMQQRVWAGNPEGAQALRDSIAARLKAQGMDPAPAYSLKQPFLHREVSDAEFSKYGADAKQEAIADTNISGTASLTPAERAIQDSRRVSAETLDSVAGRLDSKGDNATLADVLEGRGGLDILHKLTADGVIAKQEHAAFASEDGLTKAGKERISQLMVGRFFRDANQLETIAPSVRNQIERAAAPLAQIEGKGEWNLTSHVRDAIEILDQMQRLKIGNVDDFIRQDGLFGTQKHSAESVQLAKAIKTMKPTDFKAAVRQYAQDSAHASKGANTLFGDAPTPAGSFADAFGTPAKNSLSQ